MTALETRWKRMLSRRHLVRWCASSLLLLTSNPALAQQHLLVAEESTSAVAFRSQVGRVVTFICPANIMTNREIWGSDVYMVESPMCTAAVHAGALIPRAGPAKSPSSWGLARHRLKGGDATA
jgi:hypothetical protein